MPPKNRFTRQEVIEAALAVVRRDGMAGLTARALAAQLGSSARPVFSLFTNMEEVQRETLLAADGVYQAFLQAGMRDGRHPPYKASGIAYIRFAREEKQLFRLLFMRDRTGEAIVEDREPIRPMLSLIMEKLGVSEDEAVAFHREMWVFVHGIATMTATGYLDWDEAFVSRSLTDIFEGLKYRYLGGKDNGGDHLCAEPDKEVRGADGRGQP